MRWTFLRHFNLALRIPMPLQLRLDLFDFQELAIWRPQAFRPQNNAGNFSRSIDDRPSVAPSARGRLIGVLIETPPDGITDY
jgi:hypothetical protein